MMLKDKVAIVTGSSRGIGEATAIYMAKEGAKVIVNGRYFDTCDAVAGRIRADGGEAFAIAADVGKMEDHEKLVGE
ncbi:MAG: SDR family NAD(P)-dependent oxidoreductase, partial [bacterium]